MSILFEAIAALISVIIAMLIFSERSYHKRLFLAVMISYVFFYDFLNFHLTEFLGNEVLIFKLGLELNTGLLFIKALISKKKVPDDGKKYLFLIGTVILLSAAIGAVSGSNPKSMYLDFRSLLLPILFVISLIQSRSTNGYDVKYIMNILSVLLVINGIYSLIEFLTYTGEFQTYWRYRSLLKSKLGLNSEYNENQLFYQIVRGDDIRSSGFIVSALAAGYLYGFLAIYYLTAAIEATYIPRRIRLFLFSLAFLGFSYLTQVRTSFMMIGVAVGIIAMMKMIRSSKINAKLAFVVPIVMMAFLYLYLTSGLSLFKDASSQGRLVQYQTLINSFTVIGKGLGSYPRSFDSYYIYTLLEMGFFAFLIYYLFYKMMVDQRLYRKSNLHVYTQFAIFIFICSFQHVSGSLYYLSFVLLLTMNDLSKRRSIQQKQRIKANEPLYEPV